MKIWILFIFLLITEIFSAEIILSNGDIFIADIIFEDDKILKIKWKDESYEIPKSEILKIDLTKSGPHKSFSPLSFTLKDGSKVKGIIVQKDSNSFTLKTELGFLKLDKSKIESESGEYKEDFPPPKTFNQFKVKNQFTAIGIYGGASSIVSTINDDFQKSTRGGIFIEPASLKFNRFFLAGFDISHSVSKKVSNKTISELYNQYQILTLSSSQNFNPYFLLSTFQTSNNYYLNISSIHPYIQARYNPSRYLDFYINLGIGVSNYTFTETKNSGFVPSGFISIGYQGLSFGKYIIRFAARSILLFESGNAIRLDGGEFGIGYAI